MLKLFYFVSMLALIYSFLIYLFSQIKSHKKKQKEPLLQKIFRWSETDVIKQLTPAEGTSLYKSILEVVKQSSIAWMNVQRLHTISLLTGCVGGVAFIFYHLNNVLTATLNHDKLLLLAEEMGDEKIAHITYFSSDLLLQILICFFIGYFIPWGFIKVIHFRNENLTRNEAIMLKTYALMMLKTNKNVKFVIEVMYRRSHMFKEPLAELWARYSQSPVLALQEAIDKSESDDFKKIVNTLLKSVAFDRDSAVEYLERNRAMSQQLAKITNKKRNATKDSLATLLVMGPLLGAIAVIGYPLMMEAMKLIGQSPV